VNIESRASFAVRGLQVLLSLIAVFHLVAGAGLMFSITFQRFAVAGYGAELDWTARNIYFLRIVGSFAFILGTIAAMAARNPLKYSIVAVGFIEFFVLRNIHRHLYSQELYEGFGVSSLTNDLTTVFFGVQAIALAGFLWAAHRK
jgi:hypothetical protein